MRRLSPILATLLIGSLASAQTETYPVDLTGEQEVPSTGSPGIGSATVTLDVGTGDVTVNGTFSNLNGSATAAHIHGTTTGMPGRRGRNVGVMLGLTVNADPGGTSGTFTGSGTLTSAEVAVLRDGLTYLNLHSTTDPGGEIRGQIDAVPDSGSPGASLMTISGDATGGGRLSLACPASTGMTVMLIGAPLPLGQVSPLPFPPACPSGSVNLGVNLAVPPLVVGPSLNVGIPASITNAALAFQCVVVDPSVCVNLSVATRVAIRP